MTQRADIVLARFPFTDQTGANLRPLLVLAAVPGAYKEWVLAIPGLERAVLLDHAGRVLTHKEGNRDGAPWTEAALQP